VQRSGGANTASVSLNLASLNVHYLRVGNDRTGWAERAPAVVQVLDEIDADLVAFQEMETFGGGAGGQHYSERNVQLDYVLSGLPRYEVAAVGDPDRYPSTQPILYRPETLRPVAQGFFFFSPEPDQIYSRPWHARFPAFASWVRFVHVDTGRRFLVVNVHFDVQSFRNRTKSARLVVERVRQIGRQDEPVIVLGDFNAFRGFRTLNILKRAGLERAEANGATFHFQRGRHLVPAIDHILGSEGVEFSDATVHRGRYGGFFPSDHYPVSARIRF
jgi:endonuclease/exonuclease/phosphatase family metal-dependent hydrolase